MNHEKNTSDIDHLKQVLAKSFDGSEADDVPPMPEGLRDRIADQYGRTAPTQAVEGTGESFFSMIGQLFRKPAFAVGMAAVIMLVVATAVFNRPDQTGITRGPGDGSSAVTLVLHQVDASTSEAIRNAGFDSKALTETQNADELGKALAAEGVRIVIDDAAGKIFGYMPGEAKPTVEEDLPSDPAAVAAKIAAVQAKLIK